MVAIKKDSYVHVKIIWVNFEGDFGENLEVCNYVAVKLHLQPITAIGEEFDMGLANTDDEARCL